MKMDKRNIFVFGFLFLMSCAGPQKPSRDVSALAPMAEEQETLPALEKISVKEYPVFQANGDLRSLEKAIQSSMLYYRSLPKDRVFVFGEDTFSVSHLIDSLGSFFEIVKNKPQKIQKEIRAHFWVYRSTGSDENHHVGFSAYYEHSLDASLTPSAKYRFPIYGRPADLVEVDYAAFDPRRSSERLSGRLHEGKLIPYFTREEIDSKGVLGKRGLEIAWAADLMDIFFLQVQGSGWLRIKEENKLVRIRYAANNGHNYKSIGAYMIQQGMISRKDFGREAMEDYMRFHPLEVQEILNQNPRYIFFELDTSKTREDTLGSLKVPLTPRRSIATDPACFPPGALAWIGTSADQKVNRFVLNQDEGGGIKGPGRVDYFVGAGEDAEAFAVRFWQKGHLFFLVKKKK